MAPIVQHPHLRPSDEYAQIVWASHILSYLNPFTLSKAGHPSQPNHVPGVLPDDDDDDDGEEQKLDDDDPDTDAIITDKATPQLLAGRDEPIRQKFLNCIAELLANKRGGKHVAATALREGEDSVEIDIASNSPFTVEDDEYLASLARFLGESDTWETAPTDGTIHGMEGPLLEVTVTRNADRLDGWIERLAKLLGGTPARPADRPADAVQELARRVKCFSSSTAAEEPAARLRVVRLAILAVLGPEATLAELRRMAPSVNGSKAARLCRLIARPAANLRTLARIAHLLPSFRAIEFVKVATPGSTRLGRQQILGLADAWSRLGLPHLDRFPRQLARREGQFRKDCARAFPVHCDAQLLLRYEAEPSLAPSLPYIGCSKRACFLCHSLMSVLTLQTQGRGQHGVCHPLWGVGPLQSETMQQQLRQLCTMVKEKIVARLDQKRNRPLPLVVPQSSAVSDLATADMVVLRRQAASREAVVGRNHELRKRMQILLHPRSIRPPARTSQGGLMCIMCQSDTGGSGRCKGCQSVSYCSEQCQSVDRPAHQLLCSSYLTFLQSRPSDLHKLGIWFPRKNKSPKLVWVPMTTKREGRFDRHHPELGPFLGSSASKAFSETTVTQNQRRGVHIGHDIYIYIYHSQQQQNHEPFANKSLRHAAQACRGMTIPSGAGGQLVAIAGRADASPSEVADMTLCDFRHVLDWSSTHGDNTVRETPTGGTIRAVRISCRLEQLLYGRGVFCTVFVQSNLPFASKPSPLSDALGVPLQVCKPRRTELESGTADLLGSAQGEAGGGLRNTYATALMTEMDVFSTSWGTSPTMFEGGAVIARWDRADLDPSSAIRVCRYCVEVLQPLFRRALAGMVTRDDAMREVSPSKLAAWAPNPAEDGGLV